MIQFYTLEEHLVQLVHSMVVKPIQIKRYDLPVSIYNTKDNTWRVVTATGQIPTKKCNHASVYIPQHNRILLFYGAYELQLILLIP
ncbi:hypothetical protein C2G38_2081796 [Gigaspora rosea]|uniref:Uncharacterized protein n=1 Tax=Gigaspora rosea TaxID=44941 RepID=A0A397VFA2_9GLOM|nr:hypothetical protein C2G38_2081796 [Gigaspora rosea]